MLYHNVQVMARSLRFVDATALAASATATWALLGRSGHMIAPSVDGLLVYLAVMLLSFAELCSRFRVYHARRTEEVGSELLVLCEVAVYAAALGGVAALALVPGSRALAYVALLAAGVVALIGLRLALRMGLRHMRRGGRDVRNWLIIGHNAHAAALANEVVNNPHYGIRVEEILDLANAPDGDLARRRRFESMVPESVLRSVTCDVMRVREIVAERVIDEVVVTLPVRSQYDTVSRIMAICADAGISVRLPPAVFENEAYATELAFIGDIPMVTHYNGPSNYRQLVLKRAIDVVGAALGLLLLLPCMAIIALMVRRDSPGPVFFRQTRVGLHGRHFEMLKFRSMVSNAAAQRDGLAALNERDGTAFKLRFDARITRTGKWLRKYHLDELPQLWNVLRGDMSLVGPRPLPVMEAHGNEWWQRRRLTMPPGLTCLWQIEDDPHMPFRDWMNLDLAYIDGWSVWLDLKLIARTVVTVLRGNGW